MSGIKGTDGESSAWQTRDTVDRFLERRQAIPLAAEQLEVILEIIRCWWPDPKSILDLGCGDGALGRAVLEKYQEVRITFADFSKPMLDQLRTKIGQGSRAIIVETDFSTPDWIDQIRDLPFDVVLSGFAIHHQPHERKRALYGEIHGTLNPGGIFLNLEHVASATGAVEAVHDDFYVDHLHRFQSPGSERRSRAEIDKEYRFRRDKGENILAMVEEQCDWLREVGFQDVDCFFKIFELALFGGRRPQ